MSKVSVLFVCMGNICRSPTAEGVFQHLLREVGLLEKIRTDSAGTHAYHVGEPPDSRSAATAKQRGVDISHLRARQVYPDDFALFDYVLAMDNDNLTRLLNACPAEYHHKIRLFLDFAGEHAEEEVPDPYYGGAQGFDHVFDLVEAASRGLLAEIRRDHDLSNEE